MKVLVSAYACEPRKGSEPMVGWNWVKQIARFHDVWVVTRANNRRSIEKTLLNDPMPNVRWIYFDLPRWLRFWKKGHRGIYLYYYLWQIGAYFLLRRLHKEINFDLVHHTTFVNYWLPSFLYLLSIPFIWGPVGGGEDIPKAFYRSFSLKSRTFEHLRELARWRAKLDPFVRLINRRARIVLATTSQTAEKMKQLGAKNLQIMSQVALPGEEIGQMGIAGLRTRRPFRVLSLGRLIHWKGFHLGLKAFAQFHRQFPESEYWLVGEGPEESRLKQLAGSLGVAKKVCFWGALPRHEALKKLSDCNVLVHPSLHESGGMACIEAMAARRPVLCLDIGGPALQVTAETGFKISAFSPEQVVKDLAEAMLTLAVNTHLCCRMGEAAGRRVKKCFDWDRKGEQMNEIYEKVYQSKRPKYFN